MLIRPKKHANNNLSSGERFVHQSVTWASIIMTVALTYIYFIRPMSMHASLGHLETAPMFFVQFKIVLPSLAFGVLVGVGAHLIYRSRKNLRLKQRE